MLKVIYSGTHSLPGTPDLVAVDVLRVAFDQSGNLVADLNIDPFKVARKKRPTAFTLVAAPPDTSPETPAEQLLLMPVTLAPRVTIETGGYTGLIEPIILPASDLAPLQGKDVAVFVIAEY